MQKENNLMVGQWCNHWFCNNRSKWNGNTEGGYCNLIYSHIRPGIRSIELTDLTEQVVTGFYDDLQGQGLSARSVWCIHLLLRRCLDEATRDQLIPYNPVQLCPEPQVEEYKSAPLRLGQIQRYLNTAEQLGVLPIIYTGLAKLNAVLAEAVRRAAVNVIIGSQQIHRRIIGVGITGAAILLNGAFKLHPALMLFVAPQASVEVLDKQLEAIKQAALIRKCFRDRFAVPALILTRCSLIWKAALKQWTSGRCWACGSRPLLWG